ncbi:MAG TPA: hemerythrin domain-containing protein [Rhodocyclaceae bacterium]
MKRHEKLLQLSRDHYSALKLARDAKQAAASGDNTAIATVATAATAAFAAELEPHFRIEEDTLLPLLSRIGQEQMAHRAAADHAELRRLATLLQTPDAAALAAFGELLALHVRFEEREMFEALQPLLE